jgi:DNA-directed RNA polymerase specialized sigma24 family protein
MARDVEMHERLVQWGQWITVGDGSGYPTMSVLHKEWQPPAPGLTPTMKVAAPSSARQTHRVISRWSMRMRNTVVLHYGRNLPIGQQAMLLSCSVRAVHARIELSHRLLRSDLSEAKGEFLRIAQRAVH